MTAREKCQYLLSRNLQKRAHDISVAGLHAGEPGYACSACKIEQQCLYVVVAVVRYGNGIGVVAYAHLLEPAIAQLAGRHFYGDAFFAGVGCGIECGLAEWYV